MNKALRKTGPAPDQCFTPQWAAEELVQAHLGHLQAGELVIEPSCGNGQFLQVIPDVLEAIGVEIDPQLAQQAEKHTGRRVVVGDFCQVELPRPAAIIGNPPFAMKVLEGFLHRAYNLLAPGGVCGFILSAHLLQNGRRISGWNAWWGMQQEMLPRQLFPGLSHPITFVTFIKGRTEVFRGFRLYLEYNSLTGLRPEMTAALTTAPTRSVWQTFVTQVLRQLGGKGTLHEIYEVAQREPRPTENRWWREKIRQTLARYGFSQDDKQQFYV